VEVRVENLVRDLKHGFRQLARRPGFAAAAIASLALGVGLNTTLFSVVNAILLRDTKVERPERLVEIYTGLNDELPHLTTSYPDFLAIREGSPAFADMAAHAHARGILSGGGGKPALVTGEVVTANYFDLLGVRPVLGRTFLPEENLAEGANPVVILSHGLWQRRFGGRPDVLGQTLQISGVSYSVVGVSPGAFAGTVPGIVPDFWTPLMMIERLNFSGIQSNQDDDPGRTRIDKRGTRWLFVKGRLAEGRTIEEARAQVETVYARLRAEYPKTNEKIKPTLMPATSIRFHPMLDGYVQAASAVLLAAVGLVLMIACANVANMLLARAAARRREMAVRAAIGASRGRLLRQLLSESVVLAVVGGGVGVLIAHWAGRLLSSLPTESLPLPMRFDFGVDGTVLTYAFLVSLATAVFFGLAPAWSASRPELVPALKASAGGDGPRRRLSLRDALVVGQLAISLVLLVAGALLTRGLLAARSADLGFDPRPVASLSFNLQMNGYDLERAMAFRRRVQDELRALPGVEAVGLASRLPLAPDINMEGLRLQGRHQAGDDPTQVDATYVDGAYFRAVAVPLVEGRVFDDDDVAGERRVAIVNETLARKYWPGRSPLGERIHLGSFEQAPHEIVGVVRDHKVRSVGEEPRPYLHLPTPPGRNVSLAVRSSIPAEAALPMLRAAVLKLEPDVVFTEDVPAAEVAATTVAPTRIGAALLGSFGVLALLLAAVGLYGVIAYSVSLRTREVGVRMALGARPADVARLVLGQGGRLALAGVVVGAALAAGVGKVLESLLYGVGAFDPLAYAIAAALLLAVATAANLVPALQAARIDPMRVLRGE
jgi:predicted permease